MAVTAWSIENGMIQQGYTSLEETIKTWICHNYELNEVDERNREGIVGFKCRAGVWYSYESFHKYFKLFLFM